MRTACLLLLSLASIAGRQPPSYTSVRIDALEAPAWAGIVMLAEVAGEPSRFGIRFGSIVEGTNAPEGRQFMAPGEIYPNVVEVGPHAPDGSYCRMSWRQSPRQAPITLEWSRVDPTTVVGRLSTRSDYRLVAESYFPFSGFLRGSQGSYFLLDSGQGVRGERYFEQEFAHASRMHLAVDVPLASAALFPTPGALEQVLRNTGQAVSAEREGDFAGLVFEPGEDHRARFVMALGWDDGELGEVTGRLLGDGAIDAILERKAREYADSRPTITGLYAGASTAIGNNMFWNTLYVPRYDTIFPSLSRAWAAVLGGWVVGEWDAFFGSLLTAVEDRSQTFQTVRTILGSQTPRGVVGNIICGLGNSPDRSQPPIGAYATWKVVQRYPDREFLEWVYPRLTKWHGWWLTDRGDGQAWRDGNGNGLLEWGSDKGSTPSFGGRGDWLTAKWESGMDDSPVFDEAKYNDRTYTLELDDVGLNSYYALDAESLAHLADILGREEEARAYRREFEAMKSRINRVLWNEEAGIYQNRHWDGRLSGRLSPMNFYPLLAGVASPEQAHRMVREHLRNEQEFWGEFVIPSAPRNDPAFVDQYYWRGNIWGPTNYLVYQGLKRYGLDETAADFAARSHALYMRHWRTHNHNRENYGPTGEAAGGDAHYTWGALLALIAVEEYIDMNPWEGLRFGMLEASATGKASRMTWGPHRYDVHVGPANTSMWRDETPRFAADRAVVVRSYQLDRAALSFSIHARQATRIGISEWAEGRLRVSIDGALPLEVGVIDGTGSFRVQPGKHEIKIVHQGEP